MFKFPFTTHFVYANTPALSFVRLVATACSREKNKQVTVRKQKDTLTTRDTGAKHRDSVHVSVRTFIYAQLSRIMQRVIWQIYLQKNETCKSTGWPENGTGFVRLNFIKY